MQSKFYNSPCCSITGLIFNKPVLASDNHTYEEQAIKKYYALTQCNPDGIPISNNFVPNLEMEDLILGYLKLYPSKKINQYQLSTAHEDNLYEIDTIIKSENYE